MTGSDNLDSKLFREERSRNGRRKRLRSNKTTLLKEEKKKRRSMESLNPIEIECRVEDCSLNGRMRGVAEAIGMLNSEPSFSDSTTSSERSSETTDAMAARSKEENEENTRRSACESHGFISVIGRRRVMEDAVSATKVDSYDFFAVYDGHGGFEVANACSERLHAILENQVVEWRSGCSDGGEAVDWEKVMTAAFWNMDREVGGVEMEAEIGESAPVNTTGSTATVVVVGKEEIVVANCGDSRAVLWRDSAAVPLSRDHKV